MDAPLPKPVCKITETNGNVYSVIHRVSRCLRDDGQADAAEDWEAEAKHAQSYDEVLQLMFTYVEVE